MKGKALFPPRFDSSIANIFGKFGEARNSALPFVRVNTLGPEVMPAFSLLRMGRFSPLPPSVRISGPFFGPFGTVAMTVGVSWGWNARRIATNRPSVNIPESPFPNPHPVILKYRQPGVRPGTTREARRKVSSIWEALEFLKTCPAPYPASVHTSGWNGSTLASFHASH